MSETTPANVTLVSGLSLSGAVGPSAAKVPRLSASTLTRIITVTYANVTHVSLLALRASNPTVSMSDGKTSVRRLLPGGWTSFRPPALNYGASTEAVTPVEIP